MKDGIYEDSKSVKAIVEIGRNMITACEENKMYPEDDFMWNRAVVAGNKLTTIGTTWGLKSLKELSKDENKAVQHYLKYKKKFL
tara:strand:+ start:54 stop:305 length:252 start_codon:yes stop_codon:yes gene_type:complete